ncbi:MAG: YceI family protein [Bacteroidia bacterium]|nr:YceI family protein [Bacteroidia bacterium]
MKTKNIKLAVAAFTILFASAFTVIQSVNWKLKEDAYTVSFKGPKVDGVIKGLKTSIVFDEANPEKSKITATMDANTVNTGNGMKNKHAKAEDALNAAQFPEIKFESTSVSGKVGNYTAVGKLTIKGVTKEINLPFTFENKGAEAVFKGKFSIVTKDYNITKKGTPDVLEIDLNVPVTK